MATDSGTIGLAAGLTVMTFGGMLVYSAIKDVSFVDMLRGVTGTPLGPSAAVGDAPAVSTDQSGADALGVPNIGGFPSPTGTTVIDGHPVVKWIAVQVLAARKHGWTGKVRSGWRSDAEQAQACIEVCGNPQGCPGKCAKPGTSNHRGKTFPGGAVDVDDPAGFAAALVRARAAGDLGPYPMIRNALPQDPVHFSLTGH